jgi:hypothetical protein
VNLSSTKIEPLRLDMLYRPTPAPTKTNIATRIAAPSMAAAMTLELSAVSNLLRFSNGANITAPPKLERVKWP